MGFTKTLKELVVAVEAEEQSLETQLQLWGRLKERQARLVTLNGQIQELMMVEVDTTERQFDDEEVTTSEYGDKFIDMKIRMERLNLFKEASAEFETGSSDEIPNFAGGDKNKKKYKLPKLEFLKFGGEPKEWLGWWSQFSSIHEDKEMADKDKFQYLFQATREKSPARLVVESFPPTAANYPKVVEYLKKRFGNDRLLREVYIRDMISLVIHNAVNRTNSVSSIYDKLETQLRALETLGVTRDKYSCFLYPLVESSLPEDTLRTWQRTQKSPEEVKDGEEDLLTPLMKFLRREVETEAGVKLAQAGFGNGQESLKGNRVKPKPEKHEESIPTATDLFSGQKVIKKMCIFCEKSHKSSDCFKAADMILEERNKLVTVVSGRDIL